MTAEAAIATDTPMAALLRLQRLFARHGHRVYDDARREPVTALAHALQCAQLAEWAQVDDHLVAAALLHDVGHFVAADVHDDTDDAHESRALALLAGFGPAVTEPVRLHVLAKRYLVRSDAGYAASLSPASQHSLALQGGPMSDAEMRRFEALPHAPDALHLRRWDDSAKEPGRRTPTLAYYWPLLQDLLTGPARG